jgi:hypothetical protein
MEQEDEVHREIIERLLPKVEGLEREGVKALVRAEVYRRLKRLEAAETLLREALMAISNNNWPDLTDRIAGFLEEGK